MDKTQAVIKAQEMMVSGAKAFKDRGAVVFKAEMHQALCGFILAKLVAQGMPTGKEEFTAVFAAVHNHSAWRQKLEKEGVFEKAEKRGSEYLDVLDEEGV